MNKRCRSLDAVPYDRDLVCVDIESSEAEVNG